MKKTIDGVLHIQEKDLLLMKPKAKVSSDPNKFTSNFDQEEFYELLDRDNWIIDYDRLKYSSLEVLEDYAEDVGKQLFLLDKQLCKIKETAIESRRTLTDEEKELVSGIIERKAKLNNKYTDILFIYNEELNKRKRNNKGRKRRK